MCIGDHLSRNDSLSISNVVLYAINNNENTSLIHEDIKNGKNHVILHRVCI